MQGFENRNLRRVIGPKRGANEKCTVQANNEEIHNQYRSPDTVRAIKF